jgi:hypothetical protein
MKNLKINVKSNYGRPVIILLIDEINKRYLYRVEGLEPKYFVPGTDEMTSKGNYTDYSVNRYLKGNLGIKVMDAEEDPTIKLHPHEVNCKRIAEYRINEGKPMPQEFVKFLDGTDVIEARAKSRELRRYMGKVWERNGYTLLSKEAA